MATISVAPGGVPGTKRAQRAAATSAKRAAASESVSAPPPKKSMVPSKKNAKAGPTPAQFSEPRDGTGQNISDATEWERSAWPCALCTQLPTHHCARAVLSSDPWHLCRFFFRSWKANSKIDEAGRSNTSHVTPVGGKLYLMSVAEALSVGSDDSTLTGVLEAFKALGQRSAKHSGSADEKAQQKGSAETFKLAEFSNKMAHSTIRKEDEAGGMTRALRFMGPAGIFTAITKEGYKPDSTISAPACGAVSFDDEEESEAATGSMMPATCVFVWIHRTLYLNKYIGIAVQARKEFNSSVEAFDVEGVPSSEFQQFRLTAWATAFPGVHHAVFPQNSCDLGKEEWTSGFELLPTSNDAELDHQVCAAPPQFVDLPVDVRGHELKSLCV